MMPKPFSQVRMRYYKDAGVFTVVVFLCTFDSRFCLAQEEMGPTTKTSVNSFIKLDVPAKFLKGARWEIDTKNPKQIFHSVEITDISRISVESGEFRLDLNLRQRWTEENLIFPTGLFMDDESGDEYVTADSGVLQALWVPDLYFPNARSSTIEGLDQPHSNVLIFKNKTVLYYATLTATLGCAMEFKWYPLDIQRCPLYIESYTYAVNKVMFEWENITAAVILPDELRPRRYALFRPLAWYNGVHTRFGRADSYSRITIMFVFERELSQNLIQVYVPTFLIVSLSWFSFWLGLDAIPGRVGLLVTCMLTLVTMYTGLKVDIPPVEYIKILDIWMAACLLFVFAAMSEFVIVRTISHMHKGQGQGHTMAMATNSKPVPAAVAAHQMQKPHPSNANTNINAVAIRRAWDWDTPPPGYYDHEQDHGHDQRQRFHSHQPQQQDKNGNSSSKSKSKGHGQKSSPTNHTRTRGRGARRPRSLWEKIDISSRITFPLLFLSFCLVYWPILIFGSQSQKHY